jgi:hypothetical protein
LQIDGYPCPLLSFPVLQNALLNKQWFINGSQYFNDGERTEQGETITSDPSTLPLNYVGFLGIENTIEHSEEHGVIEFGFPDMFPTFGDELITYVPWNNRQESRERISGERISASAAKYGLAHVVIGDYAVQASPPSYPLYDLVGQIYSHQAIEKFNNPKNLFIVYGNRKGLSERDKIRIVYIKRGNLLIPIASATWRTASNWVQFRDGMLIPFVGMVLSFFIPGIGQAVGQFIVGPTFAATYPALTAALGTIVTQTALAGGDIGKAVTNYLASEFGASVGAVVDIPVVSNIAGSVATAAIKGGDLNDAAISGLISGGFSQIGSTNSGAVMGNDYDVFDFGGSVDSGAFDVDSYDFGDPFVSDGFDATNYSDAGTAGYGDWGTAPDVISYSDAGTTGYGDWGGAPMDSPNPANYSDAGTSGYGDWGSAPTGTPNPANYSDAGTPGYGSWGNSGSPSTVPNTSGISFDSTLKSLSNLVQLGLKVNSAVRGQSNTVLRAGALPAGTTAMTNGRLSNGAQVPVGAVYRTSNGGAVVNNGDGTYTVAQPNGQTKVMRYSTNQTVGTLPTGQSSGLLSNQNLVLCAGLGIGAVLLLKGMKK